MNASTPGADDRAPAHRPVSAAAPTDPTALNSAEIKQLGALRRLGTAGALLLAIASISSYGAASPVPNPVDGLRIIGLLSRIGAASLAISYTGIAFVVLAWLLLGRLTLARRIRRLSRTQITHTLAMWAVPFVVTPPLFSRDVYSYLAVGQMMNQGFNPYDTGPLDALGDRDVFAHQVDAKWQETATPYGPAFLLIVRGIVAITGSHVVTGIILQRLVELIGIALMVWALPRLARRRGIDPNTALWLGALNPLVLFHLIAGGHNEALMVGMMMAGLVVALDHSVIGGTVLLTLAVGVKATAGLALAFLVIALARRAGGSWRDLGRATAQVTAIFVLSFAVLTVAAGVGIGWLAALNTPGLIRSFLSLTTVLGVVTGAIGTLLGLGDHTDGVLAVLRPFGTAIGAVLAVTVMWRCWRRGFDPMLGLGVAIGLFVLLSPVVQPWYLLWAALPIAASTGDARYRAVMIGVTVPLSLMIMPSGSVIPPLVIAQSVTAAAMVAALLWGILKRRRLIPASERDLWRLASARLSRLRHPSAVGPRRPGPDGTAVAAVPTATERENT